MTRLFAHAPEVVHAARCSLPERCNLKLHKVENPFPAFPVPEGETLDSYFEQVCREGLKKRLRDCGGAPASARAAAEDDSGV